MTVTELHKAWIKSKGGGGGGGGAEEEEEEEDEEETGVRGKLMESVIRTEEFIKYIRLTCKFCMFFYGTCKEFKSMLHLRFSQHVTGCNTVCYGRNSPFLRNTLPPPYG
jgi:hypothetical protein